MLEKHGPQHRPSKSTRTPRFAALVGSEFSSGQLTYPLLDMPSRSGAPVQSPSRSASRRTKRNETKNSASLFLDALPSLSYTRWLFLIEPPETPHRRLRAVLSSTGNAQA